MPCDWYYSNPFPNGLFPDTILGSSSSHLELFPHSLSPWNSHATFTWFGSLGEKRGKRWGTRRGIRGLWENVTHPPNWYGPTSPRLSHQVINFSGPPYLSSCQIPLHRSTRCQMSGRESDGIQVIPLFCVYTFTRPFGWRYVVVAPCVRYPRIVSLSGKKYKWTNLGDW